MVNTGRREGARGNRAASGPPRRDRRPNVVGEEMTTPGVRVEPTAGIEDVIAVVVEIMLQKRQRGSDLTLLLQESGQLGGPDHYSAALAPAISAQALG